MTGRAPQVIGDSSALRGALANFPTGVVVVTVGGDEPRGMTASSFVPVSLNPARVAVCIAHSARMYTLMLTADCFGISVLGGHQQEIARHFSDRSRVSGDDQFAVTPMKAGASTGAPLLEDAQSHFECRRVGSFNCGDHAIVVAEVLAFKDQGTSSPLVYVHRTMQAMEVPR